MPTPIIECIPNFSEGRRPEVVEAIKSAISSANGVHVLEHSSDADHNRTVITFVGSPSAVEEGAFRGIAKAAELIDLDKHTGEHPRMGATDVVPFVPISGVSMQECVKIANRLGKRVGEELEIPVYLYEKAAARPERKRLENIRRGEYETIKEEIATNPAREPDFGPARVGPAGATVIGAREFLVAYNVYLTTADVSIAQKIARAVRHSSGGLRFVKALGLLVDGRAQVSMNLTNFHKTPLARVVEFIRREGERYGVAVHHSELIGLVPQEALVDAAVWYTQMDQFQTEQILEQRMAVLKESESTNFLDALAEGTPAPGGGSAAARAGAMAAGLVSMVARLTMSKKKYAPVKTEMQNILDEAETLRAELTQAVEEDAASFNAVMDAFRIPKEDERRPEAIQAATLQASQIPFETARKSARVMELALRAAEIGNANTITDAGTGVKLAQAAFAGASYNVRVNVPGLKDEEIKKMFLAELKNLKERTDVLETQLEELLVNRGGLPRI
ncbi:MAG: glutamate formimidoyltransferase [Chloroflexota bacterium]|nr:glutamate formimidoyltransferase [Chloroflexota bacterium]